MNKDPLILRTVKLYIYIFHREKIHKFVKYYYGHMNFTIKFLFLIVLLIPFA